MPRLLSERTPTTRPGHCRGKCKQVPHRYSSYVLYKLPTKFNIVVDEPQCHFEGHKKPAAPSSGYQISIVHTYLHVIHNADGGYRVVNEERAGKPLYVCMYVLHLPVYTQIYDVSGFTHRCWRAVCLFHETKHGLVFLRRPAWAEERTARPRRKSALL